MDGLGMTHNVKGLAFGGAFEKRPPGTEAQLIIES